MRDDVLGHLLRASPETAECPDVARWWPAYRALAATWKNPMDRAIVAGFSSDRVAWAFASGYQCALAALFPSLPEDALAALCVTEEKGNHPRAIHTTLGRTAPGWRLDGAKRWTTLGEHNEISAGTVLGTDPLDKAFSGERSYLRIGNSNRIREHYTISRGTAPESETVVGDGNYIMTSGHVAHNCRIGRHVVVAAQTGFSGGVVVEDYAVIGGQVGIGDKARIESRAVLGSGCGNDVAGDDALGPAIARALAGHALPAGVEVTWPLPVTITVNEVVSGASGGAPSG